MFIQDLKSDFYNVVIGKRILVIVNYDIDGICASKILQSLFKYEHMLYTVVPVMGVLGCHRAYMEHRDDVKFVVLINCGGCIDIVEVFQPDEDVIFFVCDSHRPMDVCNIYSDNQVSCERFFFVRVERKHFYCSLTGFNVIHMSETVNACQLLRRDTRRADLSILSLGS